MEASLEFPSVVVPSEKIKIRVKLTVKKTVRNVQEISLSVCNKERCIENYLSLGILALFPPFYGAGRLMLLRKCKKKPSSMDAKSSGEGPKGEHFVINERLFHHIIKQEEWCSQDGDLAPGVYETEVPFTLPSDIKESFSLSSCGGAKRAFAFNNTDIFQADNETKVILSVVSGKGRTRRWKEPLEVVVPSHRKDLSKKLLAVVNPSPYDLQQQQQQFELDIKVEMASRFVSNERKCKLKLSFHYKGQAPPGATAFASMLHVLKPQARQFLSRTDQSDRITIVATSPIEDGFKIIESGASVQTVPESICTLSPNDRKIVEITVEFPSSWRSDVTGNLTKLSHDIFFQVQDSDKRLCGYSVPIVNLADQLDSSVIVSGEQTENTIRGNSFLQRFTMLDRILAEDKEEKESALLQSLLVPAPPPMTL